MNYENYVKDSQFLLDLSKALVNLPRKRLIRGAMAYEGDFCALGARCHYRWLSDSKLQPPSPFSPAGTLEGKNLRQLEAYFQCSPAMIWSVLDLNDGFQPPVPDHSELRFEHVTAWTERKLKVLGLQHPAGFEEVV